MTTAPTTTTTTAGAAPREPDPDTLMDFVLRAVGDAGAGLNVALVVMGDKLGYYRSLAAHGPSTPSELSVRTGTDEHYAREWLNAQAAGEYVVYDVETSRYSLAPEQGVALADEESPAFLPGLFQTVLGTLQGSARVVEAARTGDGVGWHEHDADVHVGCERFFRPAYRAHLVAEWLPALAGVVAKLESGARVADIGCGHGASTIVMAQAFPASRFVAIDSHGPSIAAARERADAAGVGDRIDFHVSDGGSQIGTGFDLVTMFDCLHDMGDPVGTARQLREALADDGTLMVVEPAAGDRVEDNLNPVGRVYYGFSTLLCTPCSLSQDVGAALGTQAGPARIRDVMTAAGFSGFRVATGTPFHNVFEIHR